MPSMAGGFGSGFPHHGPASYGGPAGFASGGRGATLPVGGGFDGYPPFQPPAERFEYGREDGGRGGYSGRGGERDRRSGFGGGGYHGGGGRVGGHRGRRGFDGGRGGGRHGGPPARADLDSVSLPRQDFGQLVPFEKNFYIECPSVQAMSEHEVRTYRAMRDITVEGHDVPKPIRMFEEANFPGATIFVQPSLSC